MRIAFVLTLALLLVAGCSASEEALVVDRRDDVIDSLRAENALLQDSLQFRDDVETGRYYRELRVLQDRISRLTYDLSVLRDGGQTVAVLPADALFAPATAVLTEAGKTRLDTLAAQLERMYPERPFRIEGHSDDLPLSPALQETYPSNWELSAARAAAVVRHLIDAHALPADRFTVAAYAATRPLASNETAAGRRQNRRVRVAVLPEPHLYERPVEAAW